MHIIEELGLAALGLYINFARLIFIADKCAEYKELLSQPQVVPGIRFSFGLRFRGLGLHSLLAMLLPPSLPRFLHQAWAMQRELSSKIDENVFKSLFGTSSTVDKARLLLSLYAASWLSVAPFMGPGFHLESNEFQTGSEVVVRHGNFWLYISTLLNVRLLSDGVQDWDRGMPAGFDVTVTSPLTPVTLNEASVSVGTAAHAAEIRKHAANDRSQSISKPQIVNKIFNIFSLSVARAIMERELVHG
eukprot:Em0019g902a